MFARKLLKIMKYRKGFHVGITIIVVTLLLMVVTIWHTEHNLRADLLQQAHLLGSTLDINHIQTLTVTETEFDAQSYQKLKQQLAQIHTSNPLYRLVYLIKTQADENLFYLDSEPTHFATDLLMSTSHEQVIALQRSESKAALSLMVGAFVNLENKAIIAQVPLYDPQSSAIIAMLGITINRYDWYKRVAVKAILPILLLCVLMVTAMLSLRVLLRYQDTALRMQKAQLQQSEAQLAPFFSQSLTGFFFMMLDAPIHWHDGADKDTLLDYALTHQRINKINQAMLDQYGASEEDFLGLTPAEMFAHDPTQIRHILRGLFDKGRWHIETHEQRKDGTSIIIEGDYICLYDTQGRIYGHFGVQTEITHRKRLEQALIVLNNDLTHPTGHALYRMACQRLTEILGTDIAFIGRLQADHDTIEVIDGWMDGNPISPFVYTCANTPCANVMQYQVACYPSDVQKWFPKDAWLSDMNIQAYVGQALFDKTQKPLGILVTLGRKPFDAGTNLQASMLMGLFIDRITSEILRTDAKQRIQHQLKFERIAAETATLLATQCTRATIDKVILRCLKQLGRLFEVDRCYLFQFSPDLNYISNTHEWCAASIPSQQSVDQDVLVDTLKWWKDQLLRSGVVHISCVSELPDIALPEHRVFTQQGIKSLINVAMYGTQGTLTGFIGLDSVTTQRTWLTDDLAMLQTIAGIIGAGLERLRVQMETLASEQRASLQRAAVAELVLEPAFQEGEIVDTLARLTQVLSTTLHVMRASFWSIEDQSTLRCLALHDTREEQHYRSISIALTDCPRYVKALQSAQRIDAEDVGTDSRTSELLENYFNHVGVSSLLEAGVFINGELIGVISAEHVGAKRHWYADEHAFISTMSAIVTQLFLNETRRKSEQQVQRINEILNITGHIAEVGAWAFDIANARLWWSDETFRIHGMTPGNSLTVDQAIAFYTPASRSIITAALKRGITEGASWDLELELIRADGQSAWVHAIGIAECLDGKPMHLIGALHDITVSKQTHEQLKQAASVFEHANEGILITDAKVNILDVNAAFTRITGYLHEEVIGQNPRILKSGKHDQDFYVQMWQALEQKGRWNGEIWNCRKNGEVYAGLLTISVVYGADAQVQRYVALLADISEQKAHEHKLEHLAHYDALTCLPNRLLFADRLRQAMAQAQRYDRQVAVIYLDLDGFKAINDDHGHDAGDYLLVTLSSAMQQVLRETDTLARLGGDEFVAILNHLSDINACLPLLRRLLDIIEQPIHYRNQVLRVSASIGVSYYPQTQPIDADQLLRQADQAMYQAKLAGKNRYHIVIGDFRE